MMTIGGFRGMVFGVGLAAMSALQGCALLKPVERLLPPPFPVGAAAAIPLGETRASLQRIERSEDLDRLLKSVFDRTLNEVDSSQLYTDRISASLIDLTDAAHPRQGSFRGDVPWYPASVVKLPIMVYAMHMIQLEAVVYDAELRRQMREMIGPSSNTASQYVVDRITFTTGGDELTGREWEEFRRARYLPYDYYTALDLDDIFPVQKTWDELPTGRDRQLLGQPTDYHFEFSNKMTTDDTARLLYLIDQRAIVSAGACDHMLELLERNPRPLDLEAGGAFFMTRGVPMDSRIWSKPGSTDLEWHDAAIIELADGRRFVLVVFTHYRERPTAFLALFTRNLIESWR
ncbi:MAG: hypothetical protein Kow0059_15010 [Candidatus Sumerlaeia bacterium]